MPYSIALFLILCQSLNISYAMTRTLSRFLGGAWGRGWALQCTIRSDRATAQRRSPCTCGAAERKGSGFARLGPAGYGSTVVSSTDLMSQR